MSAPETLDARGLLCPMPVIKTQNRLKSMGPGEQLNVICTDPGALHDIPAWCRVHGHKVVEMSEEGQPLGTELYVLVEVVAE